jgi:DNA-binding NarL/FixJ family response regulator
MTFANSWPSEPANKSGKRPCRAAGGNLVTHGICQSINQSASNYLCKGCPCEWRVCSSCFLQRVTAADIRDIDPVTGLCIWHTEKGAAAIRPSDAERPWKLPSISAAQELVVIEEDEEEDAPKALDQEQLAAYTVIAKERFSQRRLLIMHYLSNGVERTEIAKLLKTKAGPLNSTILDMAYVLGVDTNGARESKTGSASVVLVQLYHYMKEEGVTFPTEPPESAAPLVLSDEDCAEYAHIIAKKFNPRQKKILGYMMQGADRREITKRLGTTLGALVTSILTMGRSAGVPVAGIQGSMTDYVSKVLVIAARHPLAAMPRVK